MYTEEWQEVIIWAVLFPHSLQINIVSGEDIPVAKTGYDFQRTFFEICPLGGFPQFSTFVVSRIQI